MLFADVKGSMEIAEQVDSEEWYRILERFFQILTAGVHRFEGMISQYAGDGIMAIFGAPIAHEDHAQRACYAALQLRENLRAYADELRRGLGEPAIELLPRSWSVSAHGQSLERACGLTRTHPRSEIDFAAQRASHPGAQSASSSG